MEHLFMSNRIVYRCQSRYWTVFATHSDKISYAKISIPRYSETKIFSALDRELFNLTDDKINVFTMVGVKGLGSLRLKFYGNA